MAPGLDEFDVLLEVVLSLVRVLADSQTRSSHFTQTHVDQCWSLHYLKNCDAVALSIGQCTANLTYHILMYM